jgi:hypothetical protein
VTQPGTPVITGAVEGLVDEAVLRRLVKHVGAEPGSVYGRNGKQHLLERLDGYNRAARLGPWLVLVDLDRDAECAPPFCVRWLPHPSPMMGFRVVVRAVEAWLFADRERCARFLSIAVSRIPQEPETVPDPKQAMVQLANHSRRREIRDDMVPRPESGRSVGPAYAARLIEFADTHWRPEIASHRSESLRRCCERLEALASGSR